MLKLQNLNKCRDTLCSWNGRLNVIMKSNISKLVSRFNIFLSKCQQFFSDIVKLNLPLKSTNEQKRTRDIES